MNDQTESKFPSDSRYIRKTVMGKKQRNLSIPWFFDKTRVTIRGDAGVMKTVAMLTMLIDHAGKMLFSQYDILRTIGRLAFPIYAFGIAVGCVYSHDILRYLKRLVILALISQPIYAVSLAHSTNAMYAVSFAENPLKCVWSFYINSWSAKPSILCTLIMGLLLVWALKEKQIGLAIGVFIACWLLQKKLDYGIRGIILILLFYSFCDHALISFILVSAFIAWWGINSGNSYQLLGIRFGRETFALAAIPFIYLPSRLHIRIPKWLSYSFYPLHLVLIHILDKFVF